MVELLAAAALFVASHLLPMRPPWRRALERRLGRHGFLAGYSLVSLALLAWLASAYFRAPYLLLWPWQPLAAWLPVLTMPFACVLLVAGLTSPNPFSLGRGAGYDPARPGVVSVTRHPVMWALALWSGSHIPVNGDLAAVVLFALMLLLSLAGTASLEGNRRGRVDPGTWARWYRGTGNRPRLRGVDWRGIGGARLVAGLALYVALLLGHRLLIGVAPPLGGPF